MITETQVAGFFSRFLKEYKFKSVKDTNVEKEADINADDTEDEANAIDHDADVEKEVDANVDDKEYNTNAIDHEANQAGLNKATYNYLTC